MQDPAILRQLNVSGNEECVFDMRDRPCSYASPPFRYSARLTYHPCPPGSRHSPVVHCSGSFPMAQPGGWGHALACGAQQQERRAALPGVPSPPRLRPYITSLHPSPTGYLLYPRDKPLNIREAGWWLDGVSRVAWQMRAQTPLLVMVAPAEIALNICPPGTTDWCDYRLAWAAAYPSTRCYFHHCNGTFTKQPGSQ